MIERLFQVFDAVSRKIKGFSKEEHRIIVISLVLYLFSNLFNYSCLYTFKGVLPPADVINYLNNNPVSVGNTSFNSSAVGPDLMVNNYNLVRDIYLRNEQSYLKSMNDSTIVITPLVTSTKKYVSVCLIEGFYNFTSRTSTPFNPQISTEIKYHIPFGIFDFAAQNISQLINYSYQFLYSREFDSSVTTLPSGFFDKSRFLTHMSNLSVLFGSGLLVLTLIISLMISESSWMSLIYSCAGILFISFSTVLSFQILNLVVVITCNSHIRDHRFLKKFFIAFGQIVLNVVFSFKLYFHCLDLIYANTEEIIANYNTNSFISPVSGYSFGSPNKEKADSSSDLNIDPKLLDGVTKRDSSSRFGETFSQSSSVYSDDSKNVSKPVDYSNSYSTPPNNNTVATSVNNSYYRNVYTGAIKHPRTSYSPKKTSFMAIQTHQTAPLPFHSPDSESTGFEQFKKDLMKSSSQTNSIRNGIDSANKLTRSKSESKLNLSTGSSSAKEREPVHSGEHLSLKRSVTNSANTTRSDDLK